MSKKNSCPRIFSFGERSLIFFKLIIVIQSFLLKKRVIVHVLIDVKDTISFLSFVAIPVIIHKQAKKNAGKVRNFSFPSRKL